jgi:hypothetical protein
VSWLTQLKLGLAIIGLMLWGYGYRVDDGRMRLFGIAFLAVAAILRFVRRGPPPDEGKSAT